jgi:hypothetical protein
LVTSLVANYLDGNIPGNKEATIGNIIVKREK